MNIETEQNLIKRNVVFPILSGKDESLKFVPKRFLLQWHVTESCNLRCSHCYQLSDLDAQELSYEAMIDILRQFIRLLNEWGISGHINFSGGEPFCKEGFLDFLKKVYEHRSICSFAILSNGTLLDKNSVGVLKKLKCRFVQVSIDGDEKTHDLIRGEGAFVRALEALKLLRKNRITSMVSFTSHKQNNRDFIEVANLCQRLKVDVIWSDRFLPIGRGKDLVNQIMEPKEVECFFEQMYLLRRKLENKWLNKTHIRMHRALNFLTLKKYGEKNIMPYRCNAGRSLLTIMPSGTVLPCRRMPIIVGDLKNGYIGDIYRNSPLLATLRNADRVSKGCEKCEHNKACNGGLRCLSYAYYGSPFKADPQCFKIHEKLPKGLLN